MLFTVNILNAQIERPQDLKDFIISVEMKDGNVLLKSKKGCVWEELKLLYKYRSSVNVNQYGTDVIRKPENIENESQLGNFILNIQKRNNMVIIYGMKGTAWRKLSLIFNEQKKYIINQIGIQQL